MSEPTAPALESKPHSSLFTRLAIVESELEAIKVLLVGQMADTDAMRKDRDEWRWRAERLLADQEKGVFGRAVTRIEDIFDFVVARLSVRVRTLRPKIREAVRLGLFRFASLKADQAEENAAVALAGPEHVSHPINNGSLDLDEAKTPMALHRPSR